MTNRRGALPSIIAHSFGTYLVAGLLEKYPEIKFDKVIFAGSIVKETFDWGRIISRGQINLLRNDYGYLDRWPLVARTMISDAGAAGTVGFSSANPLIHQTAFPKHRHSDYFHPTHFTSYWIPTLKETIVKFAHFDGVMILNEDDRLQIVQALNLAVLTAGQRLQLDSSKLRANVFIEDKPGRLSIPSGLHYNMNSPRELTICIPVGTGCTGKAYEGAKPAIAVFKGGWGEHALPDDQLDLVNHKLRWVFSTPISQEGNAKRLLGIFNIDCLECSKESSELSILLEDLLVVARSIGRIFTRRIFQ